MAAEELLLYGVAVAGLKYLLHYRNMSSRPASAKLVGKVTGINLYPGKSMSPLNNLEECYCSACGLTTGGVRDRQWMVVTARNKTFVTARAQPKLVTIATSLHGDSVHLSVPGMPPLILKQNIPSTNVNSTKVWGQDITGIDVGDEAAAWIEKVLGKPAGTYRLLYHSDQLDKRVMVKQNDIWSQSCKPGDAVQYQDGFPYLLISSASVTSLRKSVEERTGQLSNISMAHFRTNIEVEGCHAYAEDSWKEVFIGDEVKFTNVKPCGRCVMTTVDPQGKKNTDGEPLETMHMVRPQIDGSPTFGINLVVDRPGLIAVGQPVYATV